MLDTLTRLDQLGVAIAMDDFGTGYSSLSYLTRLPVKKIKIDRSFIDTLGTSPQNSAIVSSIVGLGQSLHVTITAEGVETEGQAAMLRKWGCDQVIYYGKPDADVPESEETIAKQPQVAYGRASGRAAGWACERGVLRHRTSPGGLAGFSAVTARAAALGLTVIGHE